MKATIKIILIIFIPVMILSFKFLEDDPKNTGYQFSPSDIMIISSKKMDGNNISTWYRNNGSFNRDPITGNAGFQWPKGAGSAYTIRYASGVWIGAKVNDSLRIAVAEYDYEYLPGYIDANGNPQGKDDPAYRVYVLNKGDTLNDDYINWPVDQGAYTDENGKPNLIGEQSMWLVYTDGYSEAHNVLAGSTAPLKAQILNFNWCFRRYYILQNIIFSEYRIINRSNTTWDSMYVGIWSDDDIGVDYFSNATGCDSSIGLGYTYHFNSNAPPYGNQPPAVGFLLLDGPSVYTGNPVDNHLYYLPPGSLNKIIKQGYKNLEATGFNAYLNTGPWQFNSYTETWNALQGLVPQSGQPHINPVTLKPTNFVFSGDPEYQNGWIQLLSGDMRNLLSAGPVTVAPGDTQRIVIAQVVAQGENNLNSVTLLKNISKIIKKIYELNFNLDVKPPPSSPEVTDYAPGNGKIYLQWDDSSEIRSFEHNLSGGIYKYQGYNLYQIRNYSQFPSKADTVLLKTYDIIDGVTDIYDSVYIDEYQSFVYGIVQQGSDNGISRYYSAERDVFTSEPFINGSQYKFAVTAYYYDPTGGALFLPKVIESPKQVLKVIPQSLTPGTTVSYSFGDTILTNQKDLTVIPIVFRPIDLISARYTSIFSGVGSDLSWTLIREQNGETQTLLENIKDFTGRQDTAKVIDGMLLIHQKMDSGIVKDLNDPINIEDRRTTLTGGWEYEGTGRIWITGPDTSKINRAKLFTGRQFQSREFGMSFPTSNTFRGLRTMIKANGSFLQPVPNSNSILQGGPLRKIRIIFGQNSMAYRYSAGQNLLLTDTNLATPTLFADMVQIPFSAFAIDDLDSSGGEPRQLNVAFVDTDDNGLWDPDTTSFGKYQVTYILASTYNATPSPDYMNKNPGYASPVNGFPAMDIMYAWVPRVKVENGVPMTFTSGDKLTVSPYRPTRGDFVPGYPVKYSWETQGTQTGNINLAATQIDKIKVFPNPYYGFSELEFTDNPEKMIYFSHLPQRTTIYIYTLDGVLVRKLDRNESNPEVSLEKWDLKNDEGRYVASGMYIAYIDAKAAGTKVLKLAVFTRRN